MTKSMSYADAKKEAAKKAKEKGARFVTVLSEFKKELEENKDIKVGDIVSKKYASTDEDYTKEFKVIDIKGMRVTAQDTKTGKKTGIALSDLTKTPIKNEGMGGQLDEKYFIEVSVRDARKALNIYDDMFDGAGIEMYGSNVYASNDFGDLYDLYMSFMSSNIEIIDSTDFDQEPDDEDFEEIDEVTKGFGERFPKDKLKDFIGKTINYYGNRYKVKDVDEAGTLTLVDIEDGEEKSVNYNMFLQKGLIPELKKKFQEAIKLSEGVIEEELCPKGKAYIKRRKAAGEKSSAYLSGRAVKVCKGLMSGTSKKK
jgi:hypothetical protein